MSTAELEPITISQSVEQLVFEHDDDLPNQAVETISAVEEEEEEEVKVEEVKVEEEEEEEEEEVEEEEEEGENDDEEDENKHTSGYCFDQNRWLNTTDMETFSALITRYSQFNNKSIPLSGHLTKMGQEARKRIGYNKENLSRKTKREKSYERV